MALLINYSTPKLSVSNFRYPYYVGVCHTTNIRHYMRKILRVYRAHIVLLRVKPEFRVVYISDPLRINSQIYQMYKGARFWNVVEDR